MADFSKYFPKLMILEGGNKYTENKNDKGGPTKFGITLKTWIENGYDKDHDGDIDKYDLQLINIKDAENIVKPKYWDKVKGDQINSQTIGEFLTDWAYNSGYVTAIKQIQQILNITPDGIIGPKTILAINKENQEELFNKLKARRVLFFNNIVKADPSQKVYLKGWLNRNNSFTFIG